MLQASESTCRFRILRQSSRACQASTRRQPANLYWHATPVASQLAALLLRPIKPKESCEMKRLYVLPHGRGLGVGKALVEMAVAVASRIGYREMKMDTIPSMKSAIALYRKVGFVPIAPYYETPLTGTIFLSLSLVA